MNCTTARLMQAAIIISHIIKSEVTAIQFEDGSGNKFNYQHSGHAQWDFVDISTISPINPR
jgi:hypothetical protein